MSKSILFPLLSTIFLVMLTTSCITPQPDEDFKATFYVSPEGNDDWTGTVPNHKGENCGPFKTLHRAQEAIRKHPGKGHVPLIVALREGIYDITAPITFTPYDSGAPQAPIIWTAFPGEHPVISGGKAITGWQVAQDRWTVSLPQTIQAHKRANGWDITQLFVDGVRRPRARLPKQPDFFRMNGRPENWQTEDQAKTLKHSHDQIVQHPQDFRQCFLGQDDQPDLKDIQNALAIVYNSWTASTHHLEDANPQTYRITLSQGTHWPMGYWESTGRYHLENLRSALTEPGEWHLDYQNGILTYLPKPGEDPQETQIIAPVTTTLLWLRGDAEAGLYVSNLTFQGIGFQHAAYSLPFNQCEDGQAAAAQRGAIRTEGARDCTFRNLTVAHVGGYGMDLGKGSRHNAIRQCEITDMGAGGVRIGETSSEPDQDISCAHNLLENSFIHDGGHIMPAGVGAIIFRSSYNTIRHNEICDMFYSAVSVGWSWGYSDSSAHHNIIEYNRLHHLGYGLLSDMGAVYTLGISPGTVVRGNTVHHVHAYSYGGWGLYPDEGSSGIIWEDNLVYDTKTEGFFQHYGRENVVRHNILAFSQEGQLNVGRAEPHTSIIFENNLVIMDNGRPYGNNLTNARTVLRDNIYWDTTGQPFGFNGLPLTEYQDQDRQELGTIVANPLCRDLKARDFTLLPGSPALAHATPALEAAKVAGLFGPPEWTQKPQDVTFKKPNPHAIPVNLTRPIIANGRELIVDFKDCTPGTQSPLAMTYGEDDKLKTSIRVTDEIDGPHSKHALKFVDAPNQIHEWQPHLLYPVHWKKGTVTGDFDVYLNSPDAILWHEWRDSSQPHKVGAALRMRGNGDLLWNKTKIGTIPLRTWIHISFSTRLGTDSILLEVTPQGQKPQTFKLNPVSSDWNAMTAILFVSESTLHSEFYLANVCFRRKD